MRFAFRRLDGLSGNEVSFSEQIVWRDSLAKQPRESRDSQIGCSWSLGLDIMDKRLRLKQLVHLVLFLAHLVGIYALVLFLIWGISALCYTFSDAPFTGSIAYIDKRIFFLIPLSLLGILSCVQRAWDRILDSFTF